MPSHSYDKPVRKGYTEFFSWGNDEDGQLGHGHDSIDRKKIFNLPKSLSFEVIITQVSCGFAHTSFISSKKFNTDRLFLRLRVCVCVWKQQ